MRYDRIVQALTATVHYSCHTFEEAEVTNFVASDLMSDVLVLDDEEFLLITSLSTEQSIRTADIVGARGVLLVNNKKPQPGMLALATELNKTLLATPERMFRTCAILGCILREEGHLD
ncbi:MAG: hypothetical protein GW949_06260 [Spirochaetales bacterium]|nr:hypothetical protein [Spirochaetales bacterium]